MVLEYIDLGVGVLLSVAFVLLGYRVSKNKLEIIIPSVLLALMIVARYFGLLVCTFILLAFIAVYAAWYVSVYSAKLKNLFKVSTKKNKGSKDAENQKMLDVLEKAVLDLSSSKTGAIISIETKEPLDDVINANGDIVNAPLSVNLIKSIFYVGTPLHDGAMIIKGNTIRAAAVFYTPSIKAMKGKYGARHRAAIGFSEQHDAITIVVSEETGKISFAIQGELIPVSHDLFRKRLEGYLDNK